MRAPAVARRGGRAETGGIIALDDPRSCVAHRTPIARARTAARSCRPRSRAAPRIRATLRHPRAAAEARRREHAVGRERRGVSEPIAAARVVTRPTARRWRARPARRDRTRCVDARRGRAEDRRSGASRATARTADCPPRSVSPRAARRTRHRSRSPCRQGGRADDPLPGAGRQPVPGALGDSAMRSVRLSSGARPRRVTPHSDGRSRSRRSWCCPASESDRQSSGSGP